MKKGMLLLSILLFIGQMSCVDRNNDVSKKLTKCCGVSSGLECTRGKKGRRGRRGPRGPNGASIPCGLGELFISPNMMGGRLSEGSSGTPPDAYFTPYINGIATNTVITAWRMSPVNLEFPNTPINVNFNIPDDLDVTQPVTVVVHILVSESFATPTGNQARLEVQTDYQPNNGLLGTDAPATGVTLQYSDDFSIVLPVGSGNLVHIAVPVILDVTDMANGDWAFLAVRRALPDADEYDQSIYLSTISLQYTRICS